jgi:hypothetical protein
MNISIALDMIAVHKDGKININNKSARAFFHIYSSLVNLQGAVKISSVRLSTCLDSSYHSRIVYYFQICQGCCEWCDSRSEDCVRR